MKIKNVIEKKYGKLTILDDIKTKICGKERRKGGVKLDNTITTVIAFIVSMIPIFTVIIKLNSTITKLNTTIEVLTEQMKFSQKDRTEIHTQLNNHETRIAILEAKGSEKE